MARRIEAEEFYSQFEQQIEPYPLDDINFPINNAENGGHHRVDPDATDCEIYALPLGKRIRVDGHELSESLWIYEENRYEDAINDRHLPGITLNQLMKSSRPLMAIGAIQATGIQEKRKHPIKRRLVGSGLVVVLIATVAFGSRTSDTSVDATQTPENHHSLSGTVIVDFSSQTPEQRASQGEQKPVYFVPTPSR